MCRNGTVVCCRYYSARGGQCRSRRQWRRGFSRRRVCRVPWRWVPWRWVPWRWVPWRWVPWRWVPWRWIPRRRLSRRWVSWRRVPPWLWAFPRRVRARRDLRAVLVGLRLSLLQSWVLRKLSGLWVLRLRSRLQLLRQLSRLWLRLAAQCRTDLVLLLRPRRLLSVRGTMQHRLAGGSSELIPPLSRNPSFTTAEWRKAIRLNWSALFPRAA